MIDTVEDGSTVESVLSATKEWWNHVFLGCLVTPDKAIVQIAGTAMRMKTTDLRKELRFGSPLQRLLLRYTQACSRSSVNRLRAASITMSRSASPAGC